MYRIAIAIAATLALTLPSMAEPPITDTSWALTSIAGEAVIAEPAPTLQFDSRGEASGNGGCNKFSGLTATGFGNLTFGTMVSTKTTCPNTEIEGKFFGVLVSTETYNINASRLELQDADGTVLAEFESAD